MRGSAEKLVWLVDWPGDWLQGYLDGSKLWHTEPGKDGPLKSEG